MHCSFSYSTAYLVDDTTDSCSLTNNLHTTLYSPLLQPYDMACSESQYTNYSSSWGPVLFFSAAFVPFSFQSWPPAASSTCSTGQLQLHCSSAPVVRLCMQQNSLPIPWRHVMKHEQPSGAMRALSPEIRRPPPSTWPAHATASSSWTLD